MHEKLPITRRALLGTTMLGTTLLSGAMPAFAAQGMGYKDPAAPIKMRVDDLLARMTLEEKAAQMCSMWFGKAAIIDAKGQFAPDKASKALTNGIGQIARPHDTAGLPLWRKTRFRDVGDAAKLVNDIQRFLVEKTRLGIPALFHEEAAHGLLARGATIFPIPPGLASTWDLELIEQVYTVAGREARLRGATVVLSPVVDLMREPRYGRSEEFYGEDPYLVEQMGIAAVRGLQGRKRPLGNEHVFTTLKHFVHGSPQGGLNIAPTEMSERSLRENYYVPFREIVKHADPAIIMPSYNEVEGVPSHANVHLLQGIGRREMGFNGAYLSDYGGVGNLQEQHHVAATAEDAAVLAINAGVAADLPDGANYRHLPELVRAGRIKEAQVDAAVRQILSLKFEAGLFENPYIDAKRAIDDVNTPAAIALARTAAQKALILLKNDGVLPLALKPGMRLAVIGPNAVEPLFGGYAGENERAVGILEGVRKAAPKGMVIEQADGVWISNPDTEGRHYAHSNFAAPSVSENEARISHAVEVAKRSDVILLVVGDVPSITREAVGREWPGDRSTLGLFGQQDALVEAMIATGKPIIALLINGRPLTVSRLAEKANALLEGWYLGQEGGNAFADVLFGKINPGGKLTVSFPRSVGELPAYYNRHPSADLNIYIEGKRAALFPFGHGLSYTTFDMSAPTLSAQAIGTAEGVSVTVDVTNIGKRAGDEVVQLYIRDDVSSVPRPVLELKRFKRVSLQPGAKQVVRFDLTPDDLAFWDIDMKWIVEPGTFTISVGNSSASLKSTTLKVTS